MTNAALVGTHADAFARGERPGGIAPILDRLAGGGRG
jgi:hypothetical protein